MTPIPGKMKSHVKIYLKSCGYDVSDFIPCEVCGTKAVDIHHIDARGMGGDRKKDIIENLMALCRFCHNEFGDKALYVEMLQSIHNVRLFRHRK
jgi:hypothetical protein